MATTFFLFTFTTSFLITFLAVDGLRTGLVDVEIVPLTPSEKNQILLSSFSCRRIYMYIMSANKRGSESPKWCLPTVAPFHNIYCDK